MGLTSLPTRLDGPLLLVPDVFADERGFFAETFRSEWLGEHGVQTDFVQDNHSRSAPGILRGLHAQLGEPLGKLVRCVRGAIFDVAVDLRRGSPTYGDWEGHVLDDERHRQLWVPIGFAHGFQVLSEVADVAYKLTSLYDPETESEIAWNDPDVGIEWPVEDPLLSDRDEGAPRLAEVADRLPFTD